MTGTIRDGWNFTQKLNRARLRNAWANYYGYRRMLKTKSPVHPAMPVSIAVEPTTACNLRCPQCPSGLRSFSRPTGMLEISTFEKIIDELHEKLVYLTLYFQGEPWLHTDFDELVSMAHARGIYTATSTNAHYLTMENARNVIKSGLDRIIISLDGTDQGTYEKYRVGGNLQKVMEGIENLTLARKELRKHNPFIILQFLIFRHNEHQKEDVRKLARKLGVDKLEFKTAQIYNYENGSELIPVDEKFSRYEKTENGHFAIKSALPNRCWRMWHSCVMTWDGDIVPCCFDKDADHVMGNVRKQPFRDIWNGPRYLAFRERLLHNRKSIDICANCTEGLKI